MNEVITIAEQPITAKEYKGQRVVTLADIDRVHQCKSGTARRGFGRNQQRFTEGKDYYRVTSEDTRDNLSLGDVKTSPKYGTAILITSSGYLLLAKTLTDDKAWAIQRELVDSYFNLRPVAMVPYRTERCQACGRMNPADSNYCNKCGVELKTKEQRTAESLRELISAYTAYIPDARRDQFRDVILSAVSLLDIAHA